MAAMKIFLVLVKGIHDNPGNRKDGFTVYAADHAQAAQAACNEFALQELPAGSLVTPVAGPVDTHRRAAA